MNGKFSIWEIKLVAEYLTIFSKSLSLLLSEKLSRSSVMNGLISFSFFLYYLFPFYFVFTFLEMPVDNNFHQIWKHYYYRLENAFGLFFKHLIIIVTIVNIIKICGDSAIVGFYVNLSIFFIKHWITIDSFIFLILILLPI